MLDLFQTLRARLLLAGCSCRWRLQPVVVLGSLCVLCSLCLGNAFAASDFDAKPILETSCIGCHDSENSEAGLDLENLSWEFDSRRQRERWTSVYDRVANGEMPPDAEDLAVEDRKSLLTKLERMLHRADLDDVKLHGRGPLRRMTRVEFENSLRDLLKLPHLDIRDYLPEDREAFQSNKAAEAMDLTRVQLAGYLTATQAALREAVAKGTEPRQAEHYKALATSMFPKAVDHAGRESTFYAKRSQMVPLTSRDLADFRSGKRPADPDFEVAIFRSAAWPYYGYPDGFLANASGVYRVRFEARAVRQLRDFRLVPAPAVQPMTFRARQPSLADVSGDVRAVGGLIDVAPEPRVYETEFYLKAGETFEYSLLGLPVPHPITSHGGPLYYDFPPMPAGGHPGIAFRWLEVDGPCDGTNWPPASHKVLFDDLAVVTDEESELGIAVLPSDADRDITRLLKRFTTQAIGQPVPDEELAIYERLVQHQLNAGMPFAESMLAGYRAFLCSGSFLLIPEPRSPDDSMAIATRLAYTLSNSRPDSQLVARALSGALAEHAVLDSEVDRLLADERFSSFVEDFANHWLDLKNLKRDSPDIRLYPEYRGDDYLIDSAGRETVAFVEAMFRQNFPISTLIQSDFAMINDRLAVHYELPAVAGSAMRRVSLPASSFRGGLLTQAAILKITAGGTSTSPVLRGAWVMDRVMGRPPSPPPPNVPAVEPDIRGATTIRELLAKHAESATCSACHAKFDPVGLALECYDVLGGYRVRYRSLEEGDEVTGIDRAGHEFSYRVAGAVETSGQLDSGETFRDLDELVQILMGDTRQMAKNVLQRLTVYATGTPVRFSDRLEIERILDECEPQGYRAADLLKRLIHSRIFLGIADDSQIGDKLDDSVHEVER